jgi:hypothetical protein
MIGPARSAILASSRGGRPANGFETLDRRQAALKGVKRIKIMSGPEDRAPRHQVVSLRNRPLECPGFDAGEQAPRLISACRAEAEVLFARKVRGQTTVLRFVNRRRNNSEILPEHAAEVRRTRKAPRKCDVRDGFSGLGLQLLTAVLQPCLPDIVADGGTSVAEQHVQIALGAAQCRRDLVDR